jgi:hypothetical protein
LRVVVLVDQGPAPAWQKQLVEEVGRSADVEVRPEPQALEARRRPLGERLWHLFLALDRRWHPATPDAFARAAPWRPSVFDDRPSCPPGVVPDVPSQVGAATRLDARQGAWSPDVVLDLRRVPGAITRLGPRHGAWSLSVRGGPLSGSPLITTALDIAKGSGRPQVHVEWSSAVDVGSAYRTLNRSAWNGYQLVLRQLRLVGAGTQEGPVASAPRLPETATAPRMIEVIRFVARSLALRARRRARRDRDRADWYIAIRAKRWRTLAERDDRGFRPLSVTQGHFHADPFLLAHDGRTYLFFEDYSLRERRGVIGCREVSPDGTAGPPEVVLERPYHLSYPFVFRLNGAMYLIPETTGNRDLELYRAYDFPRDWRLELVLMRDIHAADATLFQHEGTLWLFANVAEPGTSDWDALHVFFADSLRSEWRPHPLNPVVRDVRRARPAGRLFWDAGRLIRPAQDCSLRYGRAITLNRVDVLTKTDYAEVPVGRITADWAAGNVAAHGLDCTDAIEVIDGRRPVTRADARMRARRGPDSCSTA